MARMKFVNGKAVDENGNLVDIMNMVMERGEMQKYALSFIGAMDDIDEIKYLQKGYCRIMAYPEKELKQCKEWMDLFFGDKDSDAWRDYKDRYGK